MRKWLLGILFTVLFSITVLGSEIDLSGMSFEELLELQEQVNIAIFQSEGWQEVEVPVGVYRVGDEIPAGKWTVKRARNDFTYFRVGQRFEEGEVKGYTFTGDLETEASVILEDGLYVEITYLPVIFSPYVASFSFSGYNNNDDNSVSEIPSETVISETGLETIGEGIIDQIEVQSGSDHEPTLGEQNALSEAQQYLKYTAFSYKGLIDQILYEGYSDEEAKYAVENCGADWNEQAAKMAENYLKYSSFSRQGLIDQLLYEGFTQEQAEYGISAVGY